MSINTDFTEKKEKEKVPTTYSPFSKRRTAGVALGSPRASVQFDVLPPMGDEKDSELEFFFDVRPSFFLSFSLSLLMIGFLIEKCAIDVEQGERILPSVC